MEVNINNKTSTTNSRKKLSIVLFVAVLLTGALVAFLLITLKNLDTPKITAKKAATIPVSSSASCPAGGARCSWDYKEGDSDKKDIKTVTFKYTITDDTTNSVEATGETTSTSITFSPKPEHSYTCSIIVVNECGESAKKSASNTCRVSMSPSPKPSPSVTPVATPTLTLTPTPSPTNKPGVTPTVTPIPSPTPTNNPSVTPKPTEIVIAVSSPTPTPTAGPTSIAQQPTTVPPPPVSGSLLPSALLIAGSIFVIALGLFAF